MVTSGRVVSLLASLTLFNFSLGRDPVPFVCTNRGNDKGHTQTPSVTTGPTLSASTVPSSPKKCSVKAFTSSGRTNGQSTSSNSSTESSLPSGGVLGSSQSRRCSTVPPTSYKAAEEITEKFIFTFLHVSCASPVTEIFVGTKYSDVGAFANIIFPLNDAPNVTFFLNPGCGRIFVVPSTAVPSKNELNQTVNTAMVIASDEEVVVYGHQRCHGSGNYRATAFSVRGIEDLGTEYWVITHQSEGNSQVGVVATKNYTNININGVYINKTLTLNKYETFCFGGKYDLTGTHIVADKPILVIAGNSADISPYSNNGEGTDSFCKCLPPVKDWGRHFTLVPFPLQSKPFTAKILSSHDNCTLEYVIGTRNRISVPLRRREVKHLTFSNLLNINSSKGILVAQFSKGERGYGRRGNPSMLLTPLYDVAGRNEFIFPAFRLDEDNGNKIMTYITIWLPPSSDIFLDNETVCWDKIGEDINGYDIVRTTISSHGFHIIHSSKNITAVVNGIGDHKYYSYSLR